ncbi:MAG: endonuclease/exonuclease/phosphatase family protein [Bacteroidetes bacterium]|nr:endonuclease/exonuclease/phosphatase family protein [Bacteroidota bacterium]
MMKFYLCLGAFMLLLFIGCAKEKAAENQKPVLTIALAEDGLHCTISGSATDADGTITGVMINWGDKSIQQLPSTEFADFEATHLYKDPASYNIIVTARDHTGDSIVHAVTVDMDFKETSLEGIKPGMFKSASGEYLILTVNLHTYQEARQNEKFTMLADLIGKMDVDFICFQECAQHKNTVIDSGIVREDNMALILSDRIKASYQANYVFVWNWAHYGWNVWEEGVAVMSKYPVIQTAERYISSNTGTGSITSRKVIYASCQAPGNLFNVFSAHTHWRTSTTDEEQNNQIRNIKSMVSETETSSPGAISFVCGDFNGNPTSDYPWSEGYNTMMRTGDYSDTFLEIYPDANQKPAQSRYNTIGGDLPGRIDYVFMKKNPGLRVIDSQIVFTPAVVGTVSDHFGVLTKVMVSK